ncbi:MAG: hypothetical protein GDA47_04505 [Rhodospirillales bacterium]|nr:hypothetical protein [Rhodospirillales bacterium]
MQEAGVDLVEGFESVRRLIAYLAWAGRLLRISSTGPLHIAHAAGVPVYSFYPEAPLVETFACWKPDGHGHDVPVTQITITG